MNRRKRGSISRKPHYTIDPIELQGENSLTPVKSIDRIREVLVISDSGKGTQPTRVLEDSLGSANVSANESYEDCSFYLDQNSVCEEDEGDIVNASKGRSCWHELLELPRLKPESIKIQVQVYRLVIKGIKDSDDPREHISFTKYFPIPADVSVKSITTTWLNPTHLHVIGIKKKHCDCKTFIKPRVRSKRRSEDRKEKRSSCSRHSLHRQESLFECETYYNIFEFAELNSDTPVTINRIENKVSFQLDSEPKIMRTVVLPQYVDGSTINVEFLPDSKVCIYALKRRLTSDDDASKDSVKDAPPKKKLADDVKKEVQISALLSTVHFASVITSDTSDTSGDEAANFLGHSHKKRHGSHRDQPIAMDLTDTPKKSTRASNGDDVPSGVPEVSTVGTQDVQPRTTTVTTRTKRLSSSDAEGAGNRSSTGIPLDLTTTVGVPRKLLHTARVDSTDEPPPPFHVDLDVSGYFPHEITVRVSGGTVVVAAYHSEVHGRESTEYQFKRRLDLGPLADPGDVSVVFDEEHGVLLLSAPERQKETLPE